MKRKASISHDEAIIRRLRKDPDFAAEYLKAALEDEDEPRVLLIALRHLAQAQSIANVANASLHGQSSVQTLPIDAGSVGDISEPLGFRGLTPWHDHNAG